MPVEIVARRLEDGRVEVIARDVSEGLRAEAALRASEAKYRTLVEQAADGIVLTRLDGTITEVNAAALALTGYTRAELLGRDAAAIVPPADPAAHPGGAEAVRAGQVVQSQRLLRRKDGARRHVEVSVRRLGADLVQGLWRDVTAQREAEAALRASEERYRTVVEAAPIAIVTQDAAGHLIDANPAWGALLGYRPEDFAGREMWELTHPADVARNRDLLAELRAGAREGFAMEKRYYHKDGGVVWGQLTVAAVRDAGGRLRQTVGMVEDITARKRAEEALREVSARLLQAQDEERRRIARELHDVTAQDLFAQSILLARLARPGARLDRRGRETVAEVRALAEKALRDLRTQSYLLHPPLLDELGLPAALEWFAEGFVRRSGIAVELAIDPALGRLPEAIELALFRVAQEGLGNVLRHAGSATARVALAREGDAVTLRIEDRGRGLPGTVAGGEAPPETGVGLPGMRERLRPLGGHLAIVSSGQGTTLTAVVPLPDEAAP